VVQEDNFQVLTILKNWLNWNDAGIDYNIKAGVVFDPATGKFVPSLNASVGRSGSLKYERLREAKISEAYVTRKSFVVAAVGNNLGLGTSAQFQTPDGQTLDPTGYAIRAIGGNFQYYFLPNVCK
jgi:hypothetical protein